MNEKDPIMAQHIRATIEDVSPKADAKAAFSVIEMLQVGATALIVSVGVLAFVSFFPMGLAPMTWALVTGGEALLGLGVAALIGGMRSRQQALGNTVAAGVGMTAPAATTLGLILG